MQTGFYMAIGKQGMGKTCFITKLLIDNLYTEENISKRDRVFSNYHLIGIPFEKMTVDSKVINENETDLYKKLNEDNDYFNNSIMLLDELPVYLNSFDVRKDVNRTLHTFFSQLRKRNILLLGTAQYLLDVDNRIRRQCFNVFDMERIKENQHNYRVGIYKIDGYYTDKIKSVTVNLEKYYKYYNTNEIIT